MDCVAPPLDNPSVTSRCGSPLLLLTCALLMTSSHSEGAHQVAKDQMKAEGIAATPATTERLQATFSQLARVRFRHVQKLLKQGPQGIAAADHLLELLHVHHVAQANTYRLIIDHCTGRPDFEAAPHTSKALEWYRKACKRQVSHSGAADR